MSDATQPRPPEAPARRRSVTDSPFFLPWWALLLTVIASGALVLGAVALALAVRADTPLTAAPELIVQTAPPRTAPTGAAVVAVTPVVVVGNSPGTGGPGLLGPTLPAVFLSPTPDVVTIGRTVQIVNVGDFGLNVRTAPGTNNALQWVADNGTYLEIIGGPQQIQRDNFTWWQVRDPFTSDTGWAVEIYMEVVPETP